MKGGSTLYVGAVQTHVRATIQSHSLVALKENVYVHMDGVVFPMDRPDAWVVGVIGTSSAYDRCNLKLAQLTVFSYLFPPLGLLSFEVLWAILSCEGRSP